MVISTPYTLAEWQVFLEKSHPKTIDLGLERVKTVAKKLDLLNPNALVITVGGTNGKGSTVAALTQCYLAAGYKVGAFTSPYLFKYNEEFMINGEYVSDAMLCDAFKMITAVKGDISLTVFEYGTLAALLFFKRANIEVIILEVGLGGRLDAVNMLDADLAIVTSIGIDHVAWLGDTREKIAIEKAGIFRQGKIAICGDPLPPETLLTEAKRIGALLYEKGKEFNYTLGEKSWNFTSSVINLNNLPYNALATTNMATVVMATALLQNRLPITEKAIFTGLRLTKLTGRVEVIEGEVTEIYDVAHNPDALVFLIDYLERNKETGQKTRAVFSMLADKDMDKVLFLIKNHIDEWYVAALDTERAASKKQLIHAFQSAQIHHVEWHENIKQALLAAREASTPGDRIVIFGSFYTVAEARG